jgi:hypothetical protein
VATPFANVFVDPNNEEDIFLKDFLISLPRPEFYMGVSDFYDLDGALPTRPPGRTNATLCAAPDRLLRPTGGRRNAPLSYRPVSFPPGARPAIPRVLSTRSIEHPLTTACMLSKR